MSSYQYQPETYWNNIASYIAKRKINRLVAGDDEPYYEYKRNKFLQILLTIDFDDKSILEIGCGPGGNLLEILKNKTPKRVMGVDISDKMVMLASELLQFYEVTITKIDGENIIVDNNTFEISFTSTVLQHITDEKMLRKLIASMCKATATEIYIFERIEKKEKGNELNIGRTIKYYEYLFSENGFTLENKKFLNTQISYLVCGIIRKICNRNNRKEGEPQTKISSFLQKILLLITKQLDKVLHVNRDVAMLHFIRKKI